MRFFRGAVFFASLLFAPTARTQAFSNVSIKPSASSDTSGARLQILPNGDFVSHAVPFIKLFSLAYGVPENPSSRVSPMPGWTVTERFDIEAKVPASLNVDTAEPAMRERKIQQLIRSLLVSRFGLEVIAKTEQVPVYELALAQGGAKLQRAALSKCVLGTGPQGCHSFAPGLAIR